MSTPHNQATIGEIAKTVIMPGDPLRAKHIAETLLEDAVQFNSVRGMLGYTGTYKGQKVSVMGHGMGIPSIGIYTYELYSQYGVENIIRIGSCGAYVEELKLYDVLLVTAAYSDSTYALMQSGDKDNLQYPSEEIVNVLRDTAKELDIHVTEGTCNSSDVFYFEDHMMIELDKTLKKYNCLAAEMEAFALFHNAKVLGKKAGCLLTVSDSLVTHEETTPEERQTAFTNMMKIALEAALKL